MTVKSLQHRFYEIMFILFGVTDLLQFNKFAVLDLSVSEQNKVDPDEIIHSMASHLHLHCQCNSL